ncbi:type II secretion system protein N [Ectothiorhodospiraceae bacterium BW-2]|nr:type II secretion system protein N [Ectothiorhodospiraceae bacterium BW-2]
MGRLLGYSSLFLLLLSGALLLRLPAALVYEQYESQLRANLPLELRQLRGSLWQGQSDELLYASQPLGAVQWRTRWGALLALQAGGSWRWSPQMQSYLQGESYLNLAGVILTEAKGQLLVTDVTRFVPFMPFVLEGQLLVDLPLIRATLTQWQEIQGTIRWVNAATNVPRQISFGTVTAQLSTTSEQVLRAELSNEGGDMSFGGEATMTQANLLKWSIDIAPRDRNDRQLANSLALFKRPDREGVTRIRGERRLK